MGGAAGGGGDRKRTKFPWLGAARYAVVALLAALVAATVVTAIVMVLRPAELDLSVANGAVSVERPESPAAASESVLKYKITLRAYNPSGRAVIHVGGDNVVRLVDDASLELAAFSLPPFVVPQQAAHYVTKVGFLNASAAAAAGASALASRLYDGESDLVLVQAAASLSFTIGGVGGVGSHTRGVNFTFDCWPVSIGSYYQESDADDVSCSVARAAVPVAALKQPACAGGCPPPYKPPSSCGAPPKA